MARFFIDRPIFAWVIAIVIMLAGALSITTLPVAQYPNIALPAVKITSVYPGASSETLDKTVTQVIEQQMNGIDNLLYMASSSESAGTSTITITFKAGTNADTAQVQVQNKLQMAMPKLPAEVQRQGLSVAKTTGNFLMVLGFFSENDSMNSTDLADYVVSNLQEPISRLPGVGQVSIFGSQYSMRIWLDPSKLNSFRLSSSDISAAVAAQNAQVSAGQLGGTPAVAGQQLNATITAQTRLQTPEEFRNIILRVNRDGSTVRLSDVARVELGQESYEIVTHYNGKPSVGVGITLATDANALSTSENVENYLSEASKFFPAGMKVVKPYDTTPFVRLSIEEVFKTLGEAILLVFLVMYLFLQNFRATLIPTIAVPVVLLGTFGVLSVFGFSINTLTMFGMVLAIGLLVDDAIVVVENVERVMAEEGLPPKEATRKSMDQITSALVGIAMVLSAVFIPMAFFGGSVGAIYRQFSITIVSAMVLSVLVALILTPALCATLLKPIPKGHHDEKKGFFKWFNTAFTKTTLKYESLVGKILARSARYLVIYAVVIGAMTVLFQIIPSAFLPDEDQGVMFAQVQLPAGATQERTLEVVKQVEDHFLNNEKKTVASIFSVAGFGFTGRGQNTALAFVSLKDWDERKTPDLKVKAVAGRAMAAFSQIKDAMAFAYAPPAVIELGNATGFDVQLQDKGGVGHAKLMEARNMVLGMAMQKKDTLTGIRPGGLEDTPQYRVQVDTAKAGALGLSLADINSTLQSTWGGAYINDFIDRGRVKKVYMQAEPNARMLPEDINKWYVRNNVGNMVSFASFATAHWEYASPRLERYNGVPSVEIFGAPVPGKSSGEAVAAMEEILSKLPPGIGYEWTGLSLQEKQSGSQAPALYAISLLIVFLCLAALYESWSIPFSVMLVVPLGVIGAQLAAFTFGLSNDVYFQVGFLTIIGLSAKNAILIVEFAKTLNEQGMDLVKATLEACRLRLRPIVMTSLAFVLGVLPLATSNGAGSGAQNAIGIGVIGGMLTATVLGVLFVPLFFVLVLKLFDKTKRKAKEQDDVIKKTLAGDH